MTKQLIWARYGVREHGQWIDVTEKVRSLTQPVIVGLEVFGLPDGTENKLKSVWMLHADGTETTVSQNDELRPENWEELVYGSKGTSSNVIGRDSGAVSSQSGISSAPSMLTIHSARYGIGGLGVPGAARGEAIDVTAKMQSLVQNGSLDIVVTNDALKVGNPFRGQKKRLMVTYSYDGGEPVTVTRDERDWLIIGQSARYVKVKDSAAEVAESFKQLGEAVEKAGVSFSQLAGPLSATALNDLLIRRFKIPDRRLRGPMPIEVPSFHRDDLAKLFAELGFNKGAEIGVAEGNYSEILLKANPQLHLLLVDPWHAYSDNPQNKSKEKHEFAYREVQRKTAPYPNVKLDMRLSMDAVRDVEDSSLDWVYIDAMHSFDYVLMDIIMWSNKVRSGGIIALDDYYYIDRKRWGAGVVEAVQAYTSAHDISPWFCINAHKSTDVFWVNP